MRAYAQSKLALIMFTFDLPVELRGSGVTVNALHPASLMDTKMVREWFGQSRTPVDEGADALEYLAPADELDCVSGEYFDQKRRARAMGQVYEETARRRLRELSEGWGRSREVGGDRFLGEQHLLAPPVSSAVGLSRGRSDGPESCQR